MLPESIHDYNGWLILNKDINVSSFYPIRALKKIIKNKKIGHSGTLDPFANGVLGVAIGEATKLISFSTNSVKEYNFSLQFGIETDTLDVEGKIINTSDKEVFEEDINNLLPNFLGKIIQTPPKYSAVKINGVRAYDLARKNIDFEIKKREIDIYNIELVSYSQLNKLADFKVTCGAGTYIRSLARDIAEKLGTIGYVTRLERTRVGKFNIKDGISLDNILNLVHNGNLTEYLKPIDIVLDDILAIYLDETRAKQVRNGVSISLDSNYNDSQETRVYENNKLLAIGEIQNNYFKPKRVFNS